MKNQPSRSFIRRHLRLILPGLLILIALLTYLWLRPDAEVPLYTLNRGHFLIDVETKGEVKAIDSYVITSPSKVWGNIRIVRMVDEGTYVKKGDFLIQFDTAEFMQRLQEAQNDLETALANQESRQADIKKQAADLDSQLKIETYNLEQMRLRAQNAIYEAENKRKEIEFSLKKAEIAFQQLVDKIESSQKINHANLRQAEIQVEQARLRVQRAEEDLSLLTITSPTEGLVVYREIWGATGQEKVKVGASPWRNQPLLEIPDQSRMKVRLTVNEADISLIRNDQTVNIRLDAIVDTVYTGTIFRIANLAQRDSRSRKKVFEIEVNINAQDERLKPGMSARCQIIVEEIPDTLFIPIDALVTINERTGVLTADGSFRPLKTGKSNANFILIESGLREGESIRLKKSLAAPQSTPEKKPKTEEAIEEGRFIIIG